VSTDRPSHTSHELPEKAGGPCRGLVYNSYCIVWLDVFTAALSRELPSSQFCQPFASEVDREIFDPRFLERGLMSRFRLTGFQVSLKIDSSATSPAITGPVEVVVASYFDSSISITYRLAVGAAPSFCKATAALDSDQLILLAGAPLGCEHWSPATRPREQSTISPALALCDVTSLHLDSTGQQLLAPQSLVNHENALTEVFGRYRTFLVDKSSPGSPPTYSTTYVVIDVWEDISDTPTSFDDWAAPAIVEHIAEHHKSELMGILTLYPYEWPYRDQRCFERVAGTNIAIDTDDLVLVSETVTLIVGPYGRRGAEAPTNWSAVLRDRSIDRVSWPELVHILEIVLAKLHAVRSAFYRLQLADITWRTRRNGKDLIRENSLLALDVGRMLIDLDAVEFSRFASHRLLSRSLEERLGVAAAVAGLSTALAQIDSAVKNIDSIDDLRRSRIVRLFLAFITVASVFQLFFAPTSIPLVADLVSSAAASAVGMTLIGGVALATILMALVGGVLFLWRQGTIGLRRLLGRRRALEATARRSWWRPH
jgi:hypothetical protein